MASKSSQRAGDNSSQTYIENQYVGVTEERATEIARVQAEIAVREKFVAEARLKASRRIESADRKIIAKLTALELLDIFGEPSFISAFQKAQISAAQTDRESDYDILANLLAERALSGVSAAKAAIVRAIEIVDLVDEIALRGLTALWFIGSTTPSSKNPNVALQTLESSYSSLFPDSLPGGEWWIEHLDALNLVRKDRTLKFHEFLEFLLKQRPGWVCQGMTEDEIAEDSQKLAALIGVGVDASLIIPHSYKDGYYRYDFQSKAQAIEHIRKFFAAADLPLDEGKWPAIEKHFDMLDNVDAACIETMKTDIVDRLPAVARVSSWWDSLDKFVGVTHIGTALAYTNAKRYDDLSGLLPLEDVLSGVASVK
ncbi:LPO_1073/Vpar_1526 family protein [Nocardia sp. NPDC019304]|uniref:LPO_1073/Vpar_1526 family protein n=1 Tax=unclassified Nocardia TaxID=2637762 RepID=UPI0033EE0A1A